MAYQVEACKLNSWGRGRSLQKVSSHMAWLTEFGAVSHITILSTCQVCLAKIWAYLLYSKNMLEIAIFKHYLDRTYFRHQDAYLRESSRIWSTFFNDQQVITLKNHFFSPHAVMPKHIWRPLRIARSLIHSGSQMPLTALQPAKRIAPNSSLKITSIPAFLL